MGAHTMSVPLCVLGRKLVGPFSGRSTTIQQCARRAISTSRPASMPFCLGSPETNKMMSEESVINLVGKRKPRILDVASPQGEPALSIARTLKGATVTVIDGCENSMLNARSALEQHNQANPAKHMLANISFQTADVATLGEGSFELVTCVSSVTESNVENVLTQFHRVIAPAGSLLVGTYDDPEEAKLLQLLIGTMKTAFGEQVETPELLPPHPAVLHKRLSSAGFEDVQFLSSSHLTLGSGLTLSDAFQQVKANLLRLVPRLINKTADADVEAKLFTAFQQEAEKRGLVKNGVVNLQPSKIVLFCARKASPKH
eukprot:c9369_g1_i1.p1 GENE.c9369_g1_i1~~c9369_g1_i1.p1  ORF type:complete len:315 (-),score=64.96 c9369_g1_i1:90-1034(-)